MSRGLPHTKGQEVTFTATPSLVCDRTPGRSPATVSVRSTPTDPAGREEPACLPRAVLTARPGRWLQAEVLVGRPVRGAAGLGYKPGLDGAGQSPNPAWQVVEGLS